VELTVTNSEATIVQQRTFGEHTLATTGFDVDYDEVIPPPGFTFYSWLEGEMPFPYLSTDMRPYQQDPVTWVLTVWNATGEDYTISWLRDDLPDAWFLYIDGVDMWPVTEIARAGNAQFIITAWPLDWPAETYVDEIEFQACATDGGAVCLRWATEDDHAASAYAIYRSLSSEGPFVLVSDEPIRAGGACEFVDRSVWPETTFWYQLRGYIGDNAGSAGILSVTSVKTPGMLLARLRGVAPNPFTSSTVVAFDCPGDAVRVRVTIHDVAGRLVRTLYEGTPERGTSEITWDGADSHGQQTGSGVYFCRLTTQNGRTDTRKIVSVR
jgi:hypothetical protein